MHQWHEKRCKRVDYKRYYEEWLSDRERLSDIAVALNLSVKTLRKYFDAIEVPDGLIVSAPKQAINLLIDATFFGREYGFLCFHDTERIIYFHEIKTETCADLKRGLWALKEAGYQFKSVTIDGRSGYYKTIRKVLGPVPIQMCLFHQSAIITRYLTYRPESAAGKDLKDLMEKLKKMEQTAFMTRFYWLKHRYQSFLDQRHENGKWKHEKVRAAYQSIDRNMPQIFTYRDIPSANIPTTINHLEGAFSHVKERIKLHRGLSRERKKKAIRFLLARRK